MSSTQPKQRRKKSQGGSASKSHPSPSSSKKTKKKKPAQVSPRRPNFHERRYVDPAAQEYSVFYEMHSVFALVLVLVPIVYFSLFQPLQSKQQIIGLMCYTVTVVGFMVFPSGPFLRPHPMVWRTFFGIAFLYMVLLVYLCAVSADEARQTLKWLFDDELGKPFELPLYAEDCSLTYENVASKMDRFVVAHFFGWFLKGFMIRNRVLLWIMSGCWELLELSTVYYIPNFGECWWDQWFLDFLICNGFGIEVGCRLCEYLERTELHWAPLYTYDHFYQRACHGVTKLLTPESWITVEWESTSSIIRFMQVQLVCIGVTLFEYNAFLLKLNLWIPTDHWINPVRLWIYILLSPVCMRQSYYYVTDAKCKRLGSFSWIFSVMIFLEIVLIYKTQPNVMPTAPFINKVAWLSAGVFYLLATFFCLKQWEKFKAK